MATRPSKLPQWDADTAGSDPTKFTGTVEPDAAKKSEGFIEDERPESGWFNWFWNLIYQWLSYFVDFGVPEWSSTVTYSANAVTNRNGVLYVSQAGSNTGNDPATDTTNWAALAPIAFLGYRLNLAAYSEKSFDVSTVDASGSLLGCKFSTDGTKAYALKNNTVYELDLARAWDLSTTSYDSVSFDPSAQVTTGRGIAFSADGTKLYILDESGTDTVYQYTLSTAWDLSTASYASKSKSVNAEDGGAVDIDFSADGSKMYMLGTVNDKVYQYTLSTPWDVSTASYASKSLTVTSEDTTPQAFVFHPDGDRVYVAGQTNEAVFQYALTTAWDISTASYDSVSLVVSGEDTDPQGLDWMDDGTKLAVSGSSNATVFQYYTSMTVKD